MSRLLQNLVCSKCVAGDMRGPILGDRRMATAAKSDDVFVDCVTQRVPAQTECRLIARSYGGP